MLFPPRQQCTDMSFTTPGWDIQNFIYNGTVDDMGFNITNIANGYTANCHTGGSGGDKALDYKANMNGDIWYDCSTPNYVPDNTSTIQVFFDSSTTQLTINQTWVCNDKDPDHP